MMPVGKLVFLTTFDFMVEKRRFEKVVELFSILFIKLNRIYFNSAYGITSSNRKSFLDLVYLLVVFKN